MPSADCAVATRSPAAYADKVGTNNDAPISDSRSCSVLAVSSAAMDVLASARTSPVSKPSSICIMPTPVSVSPAMIARWIGAAPRHLGNNDACTFKQPSFGASKISCGRINPYATTMAASRFNSANSAFTSSARNDLGVRAGMPKRFASACTGQGRSFWPRPAGFGGCA